MTALLRATRFVGRVIDRLDSLGVSVDVCADDVLWNRSRYTGLVPHGRIAAGGSCRIVRTVDGWCAVNLPREDDLELLPAWLGIPADASMVPWSSIEESIADRRVGDVVDGGQELGLAVAGLPATSEAVDEQLIDRETVAMARPWIVRRHSDRAAPRSIAGLRVVDLSSLWAGPLCARFLTRSGADVVKVESITRPDGARLGNGAFYDWLHQGQSSVSVSFEPGDLDELRSLLDEADVVIEGSRPRALDRLGIAPGAFVAERPGRVWLSVTAYGRCGPWANRVGFGDDAAVAGGLVAVDGDGPEFVGDAIADPITGTVAAAVLAGAVRSGGGVTIDVSLREAARAAAHDAAVVW